VISPATYALDGVRRALLEGATVSELLPTAAILVLMSLAFIPLGLGIFHLAETYAKRAGLLKRNG
jgi:ABC-2 type transport system permease protein